MRQFVGVIVASVFMAGQSGVVVLVQRNAESFPAVQYVNISARQPMPESCLFACFTLRPWHSRFAFARMESLIYVFGLWLATYSSELQF
jgi:hypothetical protein